MVLEYKIYMDWLWGAYHIDAIRNILQRRLNLPITD